MKTKKLSLLDFQAVGTAELLEMKGGASDGCCCHPFNEQGMVGAFTNMFNEVEGFTNGGAQRLEEAWSIQFGYMETGVKAAIGYFFNQISNVKVVPGMVPDTLDGIQMSGCGGGGGGNGSGEPVYFDIGYSPGMPARAL